MLTGQRCRKLLFLSALLLAAPCAADSVTHFSRASELSALSTYAVLEGSAESLSTVGTLVVRGMEAGAQGSVLILQGASEQGAVVLRVSAEIGGTALLSVGEMVQVSATGSGFVLTKAGEVIAFIPNELGKTLLHHSAHSPPSPGAQ